MIRIVKTPRTADNYAFRMKKNRLIAAQKFAKIEQKRAEGRR